MYVTVETLITIGKVLGALGAIVGITWKLFQWVNHQKEQDVVIAEMKAKHEKDIAEIKADYEKQISELKAMHNKDILEMKQENRTAIQDIQEEQTLVVYGLLACLKGLNEQGCDGPVSEAIDKIEKHVNKRAHSQI